MFNPNAPAKQIDLDARNLAAARQKQLTKPPGSLGRLEQLAIDFAGWQGNEIPVLKRIVVRVYAADHGVSAQGVSAFPAEVTAQMIHNFCAGGAAISVLAKQHNCDFEVWNIGTLEPTEDLPKLHNVQIRNGSKDFSQQPAMSSDELEAAMSAGAESVPTDTELFIGGEMGIGNTTSASALMAALLDLKAEQVVGMGTGLDDAGLRRKREIVTASLVRHAKGNPSTFERLRRLGGLEIAALVGAYLQCAQQGTPILVDGFICTVAAAYAVALSATSRDWMLFAHYSNEHAHKRLLDNLDASPLLNLDMRLGEGSGAAVAIPLIRSALMLHAGMATFSDARVSDKS